MINFTHRISLVFLAIIFFAAGDCAELINAVQQKLPAEEKLQVIFDGETLDGWEVRGGFAKYYVEDGAIVGQHVKGSATTLLCTKKWYGDFILEFETKSEPGLNSGVQIRSNPYETDTPDWEWKDGRKVQSRVLKKGKIKGPQVDIDPVGIHSGGIYDQYRRGWLHNISSDPVAAKAYKKNGLWNHYRVICLGDSIKTWINGAPCADLIDTMELYGLIGLQVHGIWGANADKGLRVWFRNFRIQDLGRHVWKSVFDGKTLKGWRKSGDGSWKVNDGAIEGVCSAGQQSDAILTSNKSHSDITIRLKYRILKGNAGFYFRTEKNGNGVGIQAFSPGEGAIPEIRGLYGLRDNANDSWIVKPEHEDKENWYLNKDWKWDQMTVSAHGKRITAHINVIKIADLEYDNVNSEGHFALRLDAASGTNIRIKDIEILVPGK